MPDAEKKPKKNLNKMPDAELLKTQHAVQKKENLKPLDSAFFFS